MPTEPTPRSRTNGDWTVLGVSGPDARDFLHGQLTNDLLSLPKDRAQLSAYCAPKGQMIANFLIWRALDDSFRILLPPGMETHVSNRLRMFQLRADIEIESLAESLLLSGVEESHIGESPDLPTPPSSALDKIETESRSMIAWPGPRRRWLVIRHISEGLSLEEKKRKVSGLSSDEWRLWDIEDGVPFVRAENREHFVPQHLNLDLIGAINFEKGCYPGQEVVARMRYRGQVKFRAYRLSGDLERAPAPGDPIHLGDAPATRPCGRVIDARVPPEGGPCQILASVRVADASAPLRAHSPDGPALKRLPLPYELPEDD